MPKRFDSFIKDNFFVPIGLLHVDMSKLGDYSQDNFEKLLATLKPVRIVPRDRPVVLRYSISFDLFRHKGVSFSQEAYRLFILVWRCLVDMGDSKQIDEITLFYALRCERWDFHIECAAFLGYILPL